MPFRSSKWSLHKFYSRSSSLRRYLPPTAILSRKNLKTYLARYGTVYVKPDREHMGRGVIRVWRSGGRYCLVRVKGKVVIKRTTDAVYRYIQKKNGGVRHIVQKAIPLAKVNGRRFDIRVMMMRNGSGRWEYAGMLAKVAGKGSIITNVRRGGGYAVKVGTALKQFLSKKRRKEVKKKLKRLSYRIVRRFDRYKRSWQIGLDFGVDRSGQIYLIEVNYDYPSHALFLRLKDKKYFRKIKRLAREYKARRKKRKK